MSKNLSALICSVIVLSGLIYSQLFCSAYAQEKEVIKVVQIKVEGNKNVSSKEVIEVIKTKKGKEFVSEVLDEDLQSVYDMKFFSNVEIDVSEVEKGVVVTFLVKEKPIVKKVDFRGNENMSKRLFNEKISLKKNGPFDEETMEEDRKKIASLYKDKGYANVKVEAYPDIDEETGKINITFIDEETGKINVIFYVDEGKKITIGRVDIVGVNSFSKKKVLKLIKKTRRKKVLKEDLFKEDLNRITAFYRNSGYLDVKIADPEITYTDEETKVNIVINIAEGVKYSVGNINFIGNNVLTKEVLKKVLELKEAEIYNQEKFDKSKQNIGEIYAENGYIFIKVAEQIRADSETKIVNIDLNLNEGPLAYVGKIFITGNNKTKEYVIRREILLKEGEPFNGKKVRRSQEKIYNLGYFKDVTLDPRPSEGDRLNLIFDVVEQPTSKISAGIGYSSVDKLLGTVELGINNLFGRGQRLSLLYEIGERKKSYEIDFIEPWLFGYPYSFGTGIYDKHRKKEHMYLDSNDSSTSEEKKDEYWEERKGGSIRLGHSFSDFYSIHFGYKYEDVAISESDQFNNVLKVKEEEGWETTSSLSTTFVSDSRDNIFDASRGSRHSFSAEIAGGIFGGSHHFTKYIVDTSWYFPTIYKLVLALHLRAGIVESFGVSTEVPIYERFYVGGAETVRGYNYYGEIGPSNGGKSMIVMNIEYKYSIPETPIQLAIFYDAGNAWETIAHSSYDLKESIGFGIRFLTPVFPIRLDYGYGLQHKPGEAKGQWHFSVGQVF